MVTNLAPWKREMLVNRRSRGPHYYRSTKRWLLLHKQAGGLKRASQFWQYIKTSLKLFFFFFNVDARSWIQINYIQISEGVVQYSNQYFLAGFNSHAFRLDVLESGSNLSHDFSLVINFSYQIEKIWILFLLVAKQWFQFCKPKSWLLFIIIL